MAVSATLSAALAYRQAGLSVIPCSRADKRPVFDLLPRDADNKPTWEPFKQAVADEPTIRRFFHNGAAVAIVCGHVSGNLECLDIDNKCGNADTLFADWRELVNDNAPGLLDRLVIERTQSGGYHIWYRCETIEGAQKLARARDAKGKTQTTLETKGDGGYVLCYPTPGYVLIQGQLDHPPTITPDERALLLLAARAQNALVEENRIDAGYTTTVSTGLRPGEDYSNRIDSEEFRRLIESGGWHYQYSRGDNDYYMRPDKTRGSIGASWHRVKRVWYVFTSSTDFEPDHGYSAFSVYLKLEHGGDVKAAARELGRRGYGDKAHASQNDTRRDTRASEPRKDTNTADYTPLFDESPTDVADTKPYLIHDGRLTIIEKKRDEEGDTIAVKMPIADFSCFIRQELEDENSNKTFVLAGETVHGRAFQTQISAEDFSETRKLKAVLVNAVGGQAPIAVGKERHLGAAIQKLSGAIPTVKRFLRTGWQGGRFLIPGRALDGIVVHLSNNLTYSVNDTADFDTGFEALHNLIKAMPAERATVVLSTIFLAPMAQLAGWRNERCGTFVAGRTGSLKSSWTQCAMAIYGPDFMRDDLLIKMGQGATNNAIMSLAAGAFDLPLFLDNYKPNTGNGARDFVNLIHNILEGGEKKRLNRASELKEGKPVFSWPIVTGEDVPDTDAASLARVLVVKFPFQDGQVNVPLSKAQHEAEHLCAIGRAWIEWLEGDGKAYAADAGKQFEKAREKWANYLRGIRRDIANVLRVASNLATHELVWSVLCNHPTIGSLARQYADDQYKGLQQIAHEMANYTAESLEAARFINTLRELIASRRVILLDTKQSPDDDNEDRFIGWRTADGSAYILPAVARRMVERHMERDGLGGMSDRTLYAQMENLKYLASVGPKTTITKRLGSDYAVYRVLHLAAAAIEEEAPDEE